MLAVGDLSFVFLSFHEPNAEAHWEALRRCVPTAVRVDGVKGFVSVHKAAGRAAATERFVTVDGDTLIDPGFLDHHLGDDELDSGKILSWPTLNVVNGLAYGGAVKCWTRSMLAAWQGGDDTHLDLDVDFGFIVQYRVVGSCRVNGSALQAYRSGFREGARLGLDAGEPVGFERLPAALPPQRWRRLLAWMTIGGDLPYGQWCVWGARDGCFMAQSGMLDRSLIADHELFSRHFATSIEPHGDSIEAMVRASGERLRERGLRIDDLSPRQSAFFREALAQRANVEAFDMLANEYRTGRDLPRRPDKAFETYLAGAVLGHGNAMNNVARCYGEGAGVAVDPVAARNWLLNAAALGNPWALLRLGKDALRRNDRKSAALWLERAATAGHTEAEQLLETIPEMFAGQCGRS